MKKNILKYMSITLAFVILFCSLASLSFGITVTDYDLELSFEHWYPFAIYTEDFAGFYSATAQNTFRQEFSNYVYMTEDGHMDNVHERALIPTFGFDLSNLPMSLYQDGTYDLYVELLQVNNHPGSYVYAFVGDSQTLADFLEGYFQGSSVDLKTGLDTVYQAYTQAPDSVPGIYGASWYVSDYFSNQTILGCRVHFPDDFEGDLAVILYYWSPPYNYDLSMTAGNVTLSPTDDTLDRYRQYFFQDTVIEDLDTIVNEFIYLNDSLFGEGEDPWEGVDPDVWPTNSEIESSVDDLIDAEEALTQDLHGGIGGVIRDQDVDAALEGHSNVFTFFSDAFDRLCLQNSQIYSLIIYALILGIVVMLIGRRIYV